MVNEQQIACVAVLGATGRIGRLLRSVWNRFPPEGVRLIYQTRAPTIQAGVDTFTWSKESGLSDPASFLARHGKIDCILSFLGATSNATDRDRSEHWRLAQSALDLAEEWGTKRVFLASSSAVYSGLALETELKETVGVTPITPYGLAKREMEIRAIDAGGTHAVCLRIGNVAGADQLLLNAAAASACNPLLLDQFPDGTSPRRNYIGPQTLASVLISLVKASQATVEFPSVLNVGVQRPVQMHQLLRAMPGLTEGRDWCFRPAVSAAIPDLSIDTSLLQHFHSFAPQDCDPASIVGQWQACLGAK